MSGASATTPPSPAPYGTWPSPLSAADVSGSVLGFSDLQAVGDTLYWREYRPSEGGRSVIQRRIAGGPVETLTPPNFNVRSRVHEYGGRPFLVSRDTLFFANFEDQRLYRQPLTGGPGQPEALTAAPKTPGDRRYADAIADTARERLIVVREDHSGRGEARNALVAVDWRTGKETVLVDGNDFYGYPRLSPDGRRLAWIAWDHPNMPWDTVALMIANLGEDGRMKDVRHLNADHEESVVDPLWDERGGLVFIGDRDGWWRPYRWDGLEVTALSDRPGEFGGPLWTLGTRYQSLLPGGGLASWVLEDGGAALLRLSLDGAVGQRIDLGPFEPTEGPVYCGGRLYCVATSATDLPALISIDPDTGTYEIVRRSGTHDLAADMIAKPAPITFPTGEDEIAHAFFYPPTNGTVTGSSGDAPPLIVLMHGGPTARHGRAFSLAIQFWTTRGFGILDVNYRGSSGHGRAYRQRLYKGWGLVDVEDAVNGARHMARLGLADPHRLLIRGGSAGGYAVLAALAFHDVFAAGTNYYGISDAEALARDTHKFESRYLDQLIGPYPAAKEEYRARSPIHHLDAFKTPLLTIQGLEDKIVPPSQSEAIVSALKDRGIPVAYLAFEGEQHGLRKAANRDRALEAELYFYARILGFATADDGAPIDIENLAN